MPNDIAVIGVPTSAGAFAPGQEQAPRALREAGLIDHLRARGIEADDHGDREVWRWRPDREHRRAQNVPAVVEVVRNTAARVANASAAGRLTLVLGGDCTVGIGTVAGHVASGERVGLVYFDAHADLNIPESVPEGALDWMGMAHMLAEDGAVPELVGAGGMTPLLGAEQVLLFGWDPGQATPFERGVIERREIQIVAAEEVASDAPRAAARAGELIDHDVERLLVHFDVDVIDFTDMPLSENVGRNEGLAYADAMSALDHLLRDPRIAAMTITELNPAHAEEGAHSLERFAGDLARSLARARLQ